jgi:hypothetical protein
VSVEGFNGTNGARSRTHDHRLRRRPEVVKAHAAQKVTVGDGGRREEAVIARDEVVGREHAREVVTERLGGDAGRFILGVQDTLDFAAESLQCGGRNDALGRPQRPRR